MGCVTRLVEVSARLGSSFGRTRLETVGAIADRFSTELAGQRRNSVGRALPMRSQEAGRLATVQFHRRSACGQADLTRRAFCLMGAATALLPAEIVGQQMDPDLPADVPGRLAGEDLHLHRRLDRTDIEFRMPTLSIQRNDVVDTILRGAGNSEPCRIIEMRDIRRHNIFDGSLFTARGSKCRRSGS